MNDLDPICGDKKLLPVAFVKGFVMPGRTHLLLVCVREPGHPELDLDSSLHACGDTTWVSE